LFELLFWIYLSGTVLKENADGQSGVVRLTEDLFWKLQWSCSPQVNISSFLWWF